MATQTQTSFDKYLSTSYRPDCEYIDGEIQERNVGKWEHSRIQYWLAVWFGNHEAEWGVLGSTEQRMQVAQARVRIPDLVLVGREDQPDVLVKPPLLVVEILSPDDTYSAMQERVTDYQRMGVHSIWIIDPSTQSGQMCSGDAWITARTLRVPKTAIYVELDDLFQSLHSARS